MTTETKNYLLKKPNKFSEESALVSTYLQLCEIKSNWYLNTISPPGGEWNKLNLKKNNETISRSFSKLSGRLDLILQKENRFFLAESKKEFKDIKNTKAKEKNDRTFELMKNYIEKILKYKIKPIYGYICCLQNNDEKQKEIIEIKNFLNTSIFSQKLVFILVCRENDEIKFIPIFADNIQDEIKTEFEKIFS